MLADSLARETSCCDSLKSLELRIHLLNKMTLALRAIHVLNLISPGSLPILGLHIPDVECRMERLFGRLRFLGGRIDDR